MGNNEKFQLGLPSKEDRNQPILLFNTKVKSVSCGAQHTMVIDLDNNIWRMGFNKYGQLGFGKLKALQGDINNRLISKLPFNITPSDEQTSKQSNKKLIVCGGNHTVIIIN